MGDVEHIRYVQAERNFRFRIQSLGGTMSKEDRIRRLMTLFEQGKIALPHEIPNAFRPDHRQSDRRFRRRGIHGFSSGPT
jgi:hypothetical protein